MWLVSNKLRLADWGYTSNTPPQPTWGAAMLAGYWVLNHNNGQHFVDVEGDSCVHQWSVVVAGIGVYTIFSVAFLG
jgi:hypothetical protein